MLKFQVESITVVSVELIKRTSRLCKSLLHYQLEFWNKDTMMFLHSFCIWSKGI